MTGLARLTHSKRQTHCHVLKLHDHNVSEPTLKPLTLIYSILVGQLFIGIYPKVLEFDKTNLIINILIIKIYPAVSLIQDNRDYCIHTYLHTNIDTSILLHVCSLVNKLVNDDFFNYNNLSYLLKTCNII